MNQPQQQQRPAAVDTMPTDADFQRLLDRDAKTLTSYVPYGAKDEIKLTVTTVQNLIAVRTAQGHTCSRQDALKFIAMCQAKRLNPFEGDCFLIGYDGKNGPTFALVTAHQTYLKRAELHAEFDGMQSGIIVRDAETKVITEIEGDFYEPGQEPVGGWAKVFFKSRKYPMYKRLRIGRFNSGFAQWKVDAPGMICKCAEADALRSAFPTMLGGLYMQEEREIEPKPMAKPDFSKSAAPAMFTPKPAKAPPEPEPEQPPIDVGPQSDAPEPEPVVEAPRPNGGQNYLRAVRMLCQDAHVKEGELLDYLTSTGASDGSAGSLDELAMTAPLVMKGIHDGWSAIANNITELKKKGVAK